MLLIWKIRYLERRDKVLKDRMVLLDTDQLQPEDKVAIELSRSLDSSGSSGMIPFRSLFRVWEGTPDELNKLWHSYDRVESFSVHDYFEDESGANTPSKDIFTFSDEGEGVVVQPIGAPTYYRLYGVAYNSPICLDSLPVLQRSLDLLMLFSREVQELRETSFWKDQRISLRTVAHGESEVQTSANVEELRSFVMVFRRLYLQSEPASFANTQKAFRNIFPGHPIADLMKEMFKAYKADLNQPPLFFQFNGDHKPTGGSIIDVLLNSKFAHQPTSDRLREYDELKMAVGNDGERLWFLFFQAILSCSIHIVNAGHVVRNFCSAYCQSRKITFKTTPQIASSITGFGGIEKTHLRQERLLDESSQALAMSLWQQAGNPPGGHLPFIEMARKQIVSKLGLQENKLGT